MEQFQTFLQKAKQAQEFTSYKSIHLVLGNEFCDLDSTISTLALAYIIYCQKCVSTPSSLVIPVMNVEAKYFPVRTETCYLLKKCGIDYNTLVFKDQIDYANLLKTGNVVTSIVDHHVLSAHDKILEKTVVEIFDHGSSNKERLWQGQHLERIIIKEVGVCATLIANEILSRHRSILFEELTYLLYATIIYHTMGLNRDIGGTCNGDVSISQNLELILDIIPDRAGLYDSLRNVHNDISTLTTKQLLYKGIRIVKGIPIPNLPMLVEDYLKREDAHSALAAFAGEYENSSTVIVGTDANKEVRRDIAIYSTDSHIKTTLINILKNSQQIEGSDLLLTEVPTEDENILCFRQGNISLTQSFIVRLVNRHFTM